MKKHVIAGVVVAGLLLCSAVSGATSSTQAPKPKAAPAISTSAVSAAQHTGAVTAAKPVCDGTTVTTGCTVDGVTYKTYVYHAAVAEKSHTEQATTYRQAVTGQCTLCVDGTYSPSCATGRGACSHHGGVAQWNAPIYSNVPEYSTKTVVDAPAQAAYYEKVAMP